MIGCLILYQPDVLSLTKCKILRAMFHHKVFEIEVLSQQTVLIYIWDVIKEDIWQAVVDFETEYILSGYGFSTNVNNAKREAFEVLIQRMTADVRYNNNSLVFEMNKRQ